MRRRLFALMCVLFSFSVFEHHIAASAHSAAEQEQSEEPYFRIHVIDEATGRGVPLVELETVNDLLFVTDSAGMAAVFEPGLMGEEVFFHVRSHGYEYPADGFGNRGFRAVLQPGGEIEIKLKRTNIAERLYRVTGEGIYHDSVLLGDKPPLAQPTLAGGVLGQDSVVNAIYRGKLFWIWGDTNRARYPLGNFHASGAMSDLPDRGGLDPEVGVNLTYYVDAESFSKRMCPMEGPGPVWLEGMMVLDGADGPVMACHYMRVKSLGELYEHGIAVWNDEKEIFEKQVEFDLASKIHPKGPTVLVTEPDENGQPRKWYYFCDPFPAMRVPARLDAVLDPNQYQAFTCLKPGEAADRGNETHEKDANDDLVWAWKPGTANARRLPQLNPGGGLNTLVIGGVGKGKFQIRDVETGKPIRAHGGSVYFNEHRDRWVMIFLETMGHSFLGEVWYAEADTLTGPWVYARKIVTHDNYSFYNVKQHPYFDKDGGRRIYFEGTYTDFLTDNARRTPRYNYNQIMYALDLDDERLVLPQPVYETADDDGQVRLMLWPRGVQEPATENSQPAEGVILRETTLLRFCGLEPGHHVEGTLPMDVVANGSSGFRLRAGGMDESSSDATLFRAFPADEESLVKFASSESLVPLFEFRQTLTNEFRYAPDDGTLGGEWRRIDEPLCLVWKIDNSRPQLSRAIPTEDSHERLQ